MPKGNIYYIEVLGKALDILDVFAGAEQRALSLQEISKLSKLNKNTVFRVLYTLAEHGYVIKRGTDYELGHKVLDLGHSKLRRRDLLSVTGPIMDALRDRFRETVNLGVLDDAQIRYADVRESPERFRLAERIGAADYLHCTALGKCHLAWMPFDEAKRLLKSRDLPALTSRTITGLLSMKKELEAVRAQGYALDDEESMEGAFCVGVPILDSACAPVAALSVSGPTVRFNRDRLPEVSQALLEAAAEIRSTLGYR